MEGTAHSEQGTVATETHIRSYRELHVWQRAFRLAIDIYKLTKHFPIEERYGMTNQMRRAAYSISTNIAEGHRRSTKEFVRFLGIALGSASELETFLLMARELEFATPNELARLSKETDEILRMLYMLFERLSHGASVP